jgi:8-oxo-dGTP diphosphatase
VLQPTVSTNPKTINVVAGLVYRDGRLLVCQRNRNSAFALKWEFPGGKVEDGESDIEALRRELKEELAIEVLDAEHIYSSEHRYPNGPSVSLRFFSVRRFRGTLTNLVFEETSWVELSELENFDFLDGDRPIIEKLMSDRGAGLLR